VIRDALTEDAILPLLPDLQIRWRVHAYGSIVSTNDTAKWLAGTGAPEGTLVVAETQTGGHGRRGSAWESPPGGLWLSFVVRPHLPPDRASGLCVVAAVSVARTVIGFAGLDARIKWPNDVFVGGRKLAGVMVMSVGEGALVVGVGINANVPEVQLPAPAWYEATSLLRETGESCDRAVEEWRELSLVIGEAVTATMGDETVHGTVFGIEEDGGIVLRLSDGSHRKLLPTGNATLSVRK